MIVCDSAELFEELVQREASKALHYALRVLENLQHAEDVSSESFHTVFKRLPHIDLDRRDDPPGAPTSTPSS